MLALCTSSLYIFRHARSWSTTGAGAGGITGSELVARAPQANVAAAMKQLS
jgi:hypothetical protein